MTSPIPPLSTTTPSAPPQGERARLAEAARQFEAIFVRQMLSEARKTHFGGDELFGGQEMDTFRQMQDERFADIAAGTGALGLAAQIEKQLAVRLAPPPQGSGG